MRNFAVDRKVSYYGRRAGKHGFQQRNIETFAIGKMDKGKSGMQDFINFIIGEGAEVNDTWVFRNFGIKTGLM